MPNQRLILGSSSPFRKMLLERLMVPFDTANPDIDETALDDETPIQLVERLAIAKAKEIAKSNPDALIIGSDQVALHPSNTSDGHIVVGKPHTHERAVEQLKTASGKKIELFTGLALINAKTGSIQSEVIPFTVHFKHLSDSVIERYLRKEEPYNCAGSVKSEGLGVSLFKKFEGDDPNALIGLPLIRLVSMLENQNFDVFEA